MEDLCPLPKYLINYKIPENIDTCLESDLETDQCGRDLKLFKLSGFYHVATESSDCQFWDSIDFDLVLNDIDGAHPLFYLTYLHKTPPHHLD